MKKEKKIVDYLYPEKEFRELKDHACPFLMRFWLETEYGAKRILTKTPFLRGKKRSLLKI